jgi:hypothetical protein
MITLTRRAEVVAEDDAVAGRFRDYLQELDYDVRVKHEVEPGPAPEVDLLIYHVSQAALKAERRHSARPHRGAEAPRFWLEAVRWISETAPDTQIVVAVAPGEETADRAIASGATDVIDAAITPGIFRRRVEMLEAFRRYSSLAGALPGGAGGSPPAPVSAEWSRLELPLPELRSHRSGRIDAQAVADHLGIPLKRLAEAVGLKYAGLHKTPDSPRAQPALRPIVRVLELANRAFGKGEGTPEMARRWLNRPLFELDDESPLAVILSGETEAVETLLKNALTGIPV